jgi:hypothetical protein
MKQVLRLAVIALAPQFVFAAKPISIRADFEGGALGKIVRMAEAHFRCGVKGESDQDGRNRQANWYYFRVDGAKGQTLTLDLIDLPGEYNYRPNRGAVTGETLPWYSEDNQHWRPIETLNTSQTRRCCGFASGRERIKSGSRTSRHIPIKSCNVCLMNSKGVLTCANKSSEGLCKAGRCRCSRSPLKANLLRKRKSSG